VGQPYGWIQTIQAWLNASGPTGVNDILKAFNPNHLSLLDQMAVADHLVAAGAVGPAQAIWSQVLMNKESAIEHQLVCASRILQTNGFAIAGSQRENPISARHLRAFSKRFAMLTNAFALE
jgi:hypothetical protein